MNHCWAQVFPRGDFSWPQQSCWIHQSPFGATSPNGPAEYRTGLWTTSKYTHRQHQFFNNSLKIHSTKDSKVISYSKRLRLTINAHCNNCVLWPYTVGCKSMDFGLQLYKCSVADGMKPKSTILGAIYAKIILVTVRDKTAIKYDNSAALDVFLASKPVIKW